MRTIDLDHRGLKITVTYDGDPAEPENGLEECLWLDKVLITGTQYELIEWVSEEIEAELFAAIRSFEKFEMEPDYE